MKRSGQKKRIILPQFLVQKAEGGILQYFLNLKKNVWEELKNMPCIPRRSEATGYQFK